MRRIDGHTVINATIGQTSYSTIEQMDNIYAMSAHTKYTDATPAARVVTANPTFFTKTTHGLLTGNKVVMTTSGTLPAPLALATTYYVIRLAANTFQLATTKALADATQPMDITTQGTGNQTATVTVPAAFIVHYTAVTVAAKTITKVGHGLVTGEEVKITTDGTMPSGYVSGTSYYAIVSDADTFTVSDTQAHALAGTNIVDPTDQGAGNHTVTAQAQTAATLAYTAVTVGDTSLSYTAHGHALGLIGRFTTVTTLPAGLSGGVDYYCIPLTADKFRVATSLVNANAGTFVDVSSAGTGAHTFTATALSGSITPQCSNDVDTLGWVDESAKSVNLSSSGAGLFVEPTYHCREWRLKVTIAAGQIACKTIVNGETDGVN